MMMLVDGELEYELPKAMIRTHEPSAKVVAYDYEFTDFNNMVRMGRGPTRLEVSGKATTVELELLQYATQVDTLYTLYYPSQLDGTLDRYYQRVMALPVKSQTINADYHAYTIEMHALDGHAYDAATGQRVT
jgi:hypothetical protein